MKIDALLKAVAIVGIISIAISAVYYFMVFLPNRQKADEPASFIDQRDVVNKQSPYYSRDDSLDQINDPHPDDLYVLPDERISMPSQE